MLRHLLCAALAAPLAVQAQGWLGLGPLQGASALRDQVDQIFSFLCAATDGRNARVHGTDTYTDYSAVCAAAIHAGVLKSGQAGLVTIRIGRGAQSFRGSSRNGITSQDYGAWAYSYSFMPEGSTGDISWTTVWNGIPEDYLAPMVVHCPRNEAGAYGLWGTDVYTRDSTICAAAVHAGVIRRDQGGLIAVRRAPAPRAYAGSERNGIVSRRWGSSADAFSVTAATPAVAAPTSPVMAPVVPVVLKAPCPEAATIMKSFAEMRAAITRQYLVLLQPDQRGSSQIVVRTTQRDKLLTDLQSLEKQNLQGACPPSILTQPTPAPTPPAPPPPPQLTATATLMSPLLQIQPGNTSGGGTPGPVPQSVPATAPLNTVAITPATAVASAAPTAAPAAGQTPSGRYLVTVLQVICVAATKDNEFSFDGRGDEIFAAAYVRKFDRTTGSLLEAGSSSTRVYGDASGSTRIKAGSQSGGGGVKGGDHVPDGALMRRVGAPLSDQFPWRVWEGELRNGIDALVISPGVWESDGRDTTLRAWVTQQSEISNRLFTHGDIVTRIAGGSTFGAMLIGSEAVGNTLTATMNQVSQAAANAFISSILAFPVGNVLSEALGASTDRPIGLRRFDNSPGSDIILPNTVVVLTREIIEAALARPYMPVLPSGIPGELLQVPGPGYIFLTFADRERELGPGIYTMVLQVERT